MSDAVEIAVYDFRWPERFAQERDRLLMALPTVIPLRIEHIGSTAVPGLAAKPVIDLMALSPSLAAARAEAIAPLEALGYAFWRDNPAPERLFFVRGLDAPGRTHHLHLVEDRSLLERHLAFRDTLRCDAELRRGYEALKRRLAAEHGGDREAYTAAKGAFIKAALIGTKQPSGVTAR